MLQMEQAYPLYDYLKEKCKDNTTIDIKKICATINNISQTMSPDKTLEHYEEIQALIIHHEVLSNRGVILSHSPYDGKVMNGGRGVLYNIMNLPPLLQHIIGRYVEEAASDE